MAREGNRVHSLMASIADRRERRPPKPSTVLSHRLPGRSYQSRVHATHMKSLKSLADDASCVSCDDTVEPSPKSVAIFSSPNGLVVMEINQSDSQLSENDLRQALVEVRDELTGMAEQAEGSEEADNFADLSKQLSGALDNRRKTLKLFTDDRTVGGSENGLEKDVASVHSGNSRTSKERDAQVKFLSSKLDEKEAEIQKLKADLKSMKKDAYKHSTEISKMCEEVNTHISVLTKERNEKEEAVGELESELADMTVKAKNLEVRVTVMAEEHEREMTMMKSQLKDKDMHIDDLASDTGSRSRQADDHEVEMVVNSVFETKLEQREAELKKVKNELQLMEQKMYKHQGEIASNSHDYQTKISAMMLKINRKDSEIEQLKRENESMKLEKQEIMKVRQEITMHLEMLTNERDESEEKVEELKSELESMRREAEDQKFAAEHMSREHETNMGVVSLELSEKLSEIRLLEGRLEDSKRAAEIELQNTLHQHDRHNRELAKERLENEKEIETLKNELQVCKQNAATHQEKAKEISEKQERDLSLMLSKLDEKESMVQQLKAESDALKRNSVNSKVTIAQMREHVKKSSQMSKSLAQRDTEVQLLKNERADMRLEMELHLAELTKLRLMRKESSDHSEKETKLLLAQIESSKRDAENREIEMGKMSQEHDKEIASMTSELCEMKKEKEKLSSTLESLKREFENHKAQMSQKSEELESNKGFTSSEPERKENKSQELKREDESGTGEDERENSFASTTELEQKDKEIQKLRSEVVSLKFEVLQKQRAYMSSLPKERDTGSSEPYVHQLEEKTRTVKKLERQLDHMKKEAERTHAEMTERSRQFETKVMVVTEERDEREKEVRKLKADLRFQEAKRRQMKAELESLGFFGKEVAGDETKSAKKGISSKEKLPPLQSVTPSTTPTKEKERKTPSVYERLHKTETAVSVMKRSRAGKGPAARSCTPKRRLVRELSAGSLVSQTTQKSEIDEMSCLSIESTDPTVVPRLLQLSSKARRSLMIPPAWILIGLSCGGFAVFCAVRGFFSPVGFILWFVVSVGIGATAILNL